MAMFSSPSKLQHKENVFLKIKFKLLYEKKLLYINFMLFPQIFLYLTRAGLSWTPGRGS